MTHITVLALSESLSNVAGLLSESSSYSAVTEILLLTVVLPYPFLFRLSSIRILSMLILRSYQHLYALRCCGLGRIIVEAVAFAGTFGIVLCRCTGPDLDVESLTGISEHVLDFVSALGYGLETEELHRR